MKKEGKEQMKELTIQIPEKPYYRTDVILGLMEENQIAFKGKGEHLVMPLTKEGLSFEENEQLFNLAINSVRYHLEKQGILRKFGETVKIICLNCGKQIEVPYKRRNRKFCNLSCSSEYTAKQSHKKGLIKVERNDKTGRFIAKFD